MQTEILVSPTVDAIVEPSGDEIIRLKQLLEIFRGVSLRKTSNGACGQLLGEYYTVDSSTEALIAHHVQIDPALVEIESDLNRAAKFWTASQTRVCKNNGGSALTLHDAFQRVNLSPRECDHEDDCGHCECCGNCMECGLSHLEGHDCRCPSLSPPNLKV